MATDTMSKEQLQDLPGQEESQILKLNGCLPWAEGNPRNEASSRGQSQMGSDAETSRRSTSTFNGTLKSVPPSNAHITSEGSSFTMRGYVAAVREVDVKKCWPFSLKSLQECLEEGRDPLLPPLCPPGCVKMNIQEDHHHKLTGFCHRNSNCPSLKGHNLELQLDLGERQGTNDFKKTLEMSSQPENGHQIKELNSPIKEITGFNNLCMSKSADEAGLKVVATEVLPETKSAQGGHLEGLIQKNCCGTCTDYNQSVPNFKNSEPTSNMLSVVLSSSQESGQQTGIKVLGEMEGCASMDSSSIVESQTVSSVSEQTNKSLEATAVEMQEKNEMKTSNVTAKVEFLREESFSDENQDETNRTEAPREEGLSGDTQAETIKPGLQIYPSNKDKQKDSKPKPGDLVIKVPQYESIVEMDGNIIPADTSQHGLKMIKETSNSKEIESKLDEVGTQMLKLEGGQTELKDTEMKLNPEMECLYVGEESQPKNPEVIEEKEVAVVPEPLVLTESLCFHKSCELPKEPQEVSMKENDLIEGDPYPGEGYLQVASEDETSEEEKSEHWERFAEIGNLMAFSEPLVPQKCPVCLTFQSSSNTALNAHIDHCLAVADKDKAQPKLQRSKSKTRKKRSIAELCSTAPPRILEDVEQSIYHNSKKNNQKGTNAGKRSRPHKQKPQTSDSTVKRRRRMPDLKNNATKGKRKQDIQSLSAEALESARKRQHIGESVNAQCILMPNKATTPCRKSLKDQRTVAAEGTSCDHVDSMEVSRPHLEMKKANLFLRDQKIHSQMSTKQKQSSKNKTCQNDHSAQKNSGINYLWANRNKDVSLEIAELIAHGQHEHTKDIQHALQNSLDKMETGEHAMNLPFLHLNQSKISEKWLERPRGCSLLARESLARQAIITETTMLPVGTAINMLIPLQSSLTSCNIDSSHSLQKFSASRDSNGKRSKDIAAESGTVLIDRSTEESRTAQNGKCFNNASLAAASEIGKSNEQERGSHAEYKKAEKAFSSVLHIEGKNHLEITNYPEKPVGEGAQPLKQSQTQLGITHEARNSAELVGTIPSTLCEKGLKGGVDATKSMELPSKQMASQPADEEPQVALLSLSRHQSPSGIGLRFGDTESRNSQVGGDMEPSRLPLGLTGISELHKDKGNAFTMEAEKSSMPETSETLEETESNRKMGLEDSLITSGIINVPKQGGFSLSVWKKEVIRKPGKSQRSLSRTRSTNLRPSVMIQSCSVPSGASTTTTPLTNINGFVNQGQEVASANITSADGVSNQHLEMNNMQYKVTGLTQSIFYSRAQGPPQTAVGDDIGVTAAGNLDKTFFKVPATCSNSAAQKVIQTKPGPSAISNESTEAVLSQMNRMSTEQEKQIGLGCPAVNQTLPLPATGSHSSTRMTTVPSSQPNNVLFLPSASPWTSNEPDLSTNRHPPNLPAWMQAAIQSQPPVSLSQGKHGKVLEQASLLRSTATSSLDIPGEPTMFNRFGKPVLRLMGKTMVVTPGCDQQEAEMCLSQSNKNHQPSGGVVNCLNPAVLVDNCTRPDLIKKTQTQLLQVAGSGTSITGLGLSWQDGEPKLSKKHPKVNIPEHQSERQCQHLQPQCFMTNQPLVTDSRHHKYAPTPTLLEHDTTHGSTVGTLQAKMFVASTPFSQAVPQVFVPEMQNSGWLGNQGKFAPSFHIRPVQTPRLSMMDTLARAGYSILSTPQDSKCAPSLVINNSTIPIGSKIGNFQNTERTKQQVPFTVNTAIWADCCSINPQCPCYSCQRRRLTQQQNLSIDAQSCAVVLAAPNSSAMPVISPIQSRQIQTSGTGFLLPPWIIDSKKHQRAQPGGDLIIIDDEEDQGGSSDAKTSTTPQTPNISVNMQTPCQLPLVGKATDTLSTSPSASPFIVQSPSLPFSIPTPTSLSQFSGNSRYIRPPLPTLATTSGSASPSAAAVDYVGSKTHLQANISLNPGVPKSGTVKGLRCSGQLLNQDGGQGQIKEPVVTTKKGSADTQHISSSQKSVCEGRTINADKDFISKSRAKSSSPSSPLLQPNGMEMENTNPETASSVQPLGTAKQFREGAIRCQQQPPLTCHDVVTSVSTTVAQPQSSKQATARSIVTEDKPSRFHSDLQSKLANFESFGLSSTPAQNTSSVGSFVGVCSTNMNPAEMDCQDSGHFEVSVPTSLSRAKSRANQSYFSQSKADCHCSPSGPQSTKKAIGSFSATDPVISEARLPLASSEKNKFCLLNPAPGNGKFVQPYTGTRPSKQTGELPVIFDSSNKIFFCSAAGRLATERYLDAAGSQRGNMSATNVATSPSLSQDFSLASSYPKTSPSQNVKSSGMKPIKSGMKFVIVNGRVSMQDTIRDNKTEVSVQPLNAGNSNHPAKVCLVNNRHLTIQPMRSNTNNTQQSTGPFSGERAAQTSDKQAAEGRPSSATVSYSESGLLDNEVLRSHKLIPAQVNNSTTQGRQWSSNRPAITASSRGTSAQQIVPAYSMQPIPANVASSAETMAHSLGISTTISLSSANTQTAFPNEGLSTSLWSPSPMMASQQHFPSPTPSTLNVSLPMAKRGSTSLPTNTFEAGNGMPTSRPALDTICQQTTVSSKPPLPKAGSASSKSSIAKRTPESHQGGRVPSQTMSAKLIRIEEIRKAADAQRL